MFIGLWIVHLVFLGFLKIHFLTLSLSLSLYFNLYFSPHFFLTGLSLSIFSIYLCFFFFRFFIPFSISFFSFHIPLLTEANKRALARLKMLPTSYLFTNYMYLKNMIKQDLALKNQQTLICHKTKPTNISLYFSFSFSFFFSFLFSPVFYTLLSFFLSFFLSF